MENTKQNKLGAGIITISIIQLILSAFGLLVTVLLLMPSFESSMQQITGMSFEQMGLSKVTLTISLISVILVIIGIILILMKKALGVYLYFLVIIANIISSIIMNGFSITSLIGSLILPVLMAIFVYKKKAIFGLAK